MKKFFYLSAILFLVLGASLGGLGRTTAAAASVTPVYVAGNPTCADLGYTYGLKFDYPSKSPGTYPLGTGTVTWTLTNNKVVDWTSTFGVDAVIVKGGPNANVYKYDPPAESFGDSGLVSPINVGGNLPDLSHVDFCYDYEVKVTKNADPTFTRTKSWGWSIDKVGDKSTIELTAGMTFDMKYWVTVKPTELRFVDSNWAVSGTIIVSNPDPTFPAKITAVSDVVSPAIVAPVICPVDFPNNLPAGGTLICTYGPVSLPDGASRVNTATVTTAADSKVGGASGTANVVFTTPTSMAHVDDCVTITDDKLPGQSWKICLSDPYTIEYTLTVKANEWFCDVPFVNTATFVSDDKGVTGSDSWSVLPTCNGCTLTIGYWKNHAGFGPQKDMVSQYLPQYLGSVGGTQTVAVTTAKIAVDVLNQNVYGTASNGITKLYAQLLGAKLNIANGASGSAIAVVISEADAFLSAKRFTHWDSLSKADKAMVLTWHYKLDQYNNGLLGPGHCK